MSSENRAVNRLLVVGYDGATWDLAEKWAQAGKLPVLARLMKQGGYGPLRSVMPILSPAAWASFATGVQPGKHGIFDFVERSQGDYHLRPVTALDMKAPTFWRLASQAGKRVAVINVPVTYPPAEVNGIMVTGLGTPEQRPFTFPPALGPELRARGYRVNRTVFFEPGREEAYLQDVYEMTDRLAEAALELFRREAWDLFVVVFRDLDELSHYFWKHMDATHPQHDPLTDVRYQDEILKFYQHLDQKLGTLLEAAGPEVNVILVSDHGFGPLYRDVFLNEWLKQEGLLATVAVVQPPLQRALLRVGLTRQRISRTLQRMGLAAFERRLRTWLGDRKELLPAHERAVFPEAVDWTRTLAYSFGYHGQVFVNLRGREPQGIVEPGAEYEQLLARLEEKLAALVDPADGKRVVTRMIRGTALFGDAVNTGAPDLVLLMRDLAYITRQGYEFGAVPGVVFQQPASFETGSHREDGIAVFAGPDFVQQSWQTPYSIQDIAPTILQLLGMAGQAHMDGRVLVEQLIPAARAAPHPVSNGSARLPEDSPVGDQSQPSAADEPVLSPEEEAELAERLRRLGYLG